MSLILDALRQADSERGRTALPGVFRQPMPDIGPPRGPEHRPRLWLVGAALAACVVWVAWPYTHRGAPPPASLQPPAQASADLTPAAPATTHPAPARPDAEPLFRPTTVMATAQMPPGPAAAALIRPRASAPDTATAAAAANAAPAGVPQAPKPPAGSRSLADPPETAQVPIGSDLPADIRAQLPKLNVTGHTYSDNPTLRMLMIDGHMVVEGQSISPGLRLERIGPHQAVLNHRGTRFGVDY